MLEVRNISKSFAEQDAIVDLSLSVQDGSIFGIFGSNGAGKSTLFKILTGIYVQDYGQVLYDNSPVYNNPVTKQKVFLVPDTPCFFKNASLYTMANFYKTCYPTWSDDIFQNLIAEFPLNPHAALHSFSKGMQRQAAILLALSIRPKYLLLDEAFDGLDPVMRNLLKRILAKEVADKGMTVLIASHNLRELDGFCDTVALLHQGHVVFQSELEGAKLLTHKIQMAFQRGENLTKIKESIQNLGLNLLHLESRGSILLLVVRGEIDKIRKNLEQLHPVLLDSISLTLEELFIYELEGKGYALKTFIKDEE